MSPTNDAIGPSPPFASPHCFFSFCWQLYGFINIATREWKDGLLSVVMRDYQNAPDSNPKWVILDGDLDANWIENMNSVMDDNRLLTLASNERIRMLMNMKMIFEIRDLAFASPATVTRAGVLYITDSAQWKNYVQAWLDQWAEGLNLPRSAEKMRAEFRTKGAEMVRANRAVSTRRRPFGLTPQLIPLPCAPAVTHPHLHAAIPRSTTGLSQFEKYCDKTLLELEINFRHVVPLLDFGLVQTITNFLQGLWTIDNLGSKDTNAIEIYFVFAAVWGFGGGFTISSGVRQLVSIGSAHDGACSSSAIAMGQAKSSLAGAMSFALLALVAVASAASAASSAAIGWKIVLVLVVLLVAVTVVAAAIVHGKSLDSGWSSSVARVA